MVRISGTVFTVATLLMFAGAQDAEARHRRPGMHGWCRADAAQMMGVGRRAVTLERHVLRVEGGRYRLGGVADHGRYGARSFICHFDRRGVLQGAV